MQDLTGCLAHTSAATCIPHACYADDKVLAIEAEALFRNGWISFGRSGRFAAPGDCEAFDIAGDPRGLPADPLRFPDSGAIGCTIGLRL